MSPFATLVQSLTPDPQGWSAAVGDEWRQGRTLYGGVSAALCVEAAQRALPEPRPLRSAQFAFVGPAAGAVTARATILRQGKSTIFVAATLHGEAGLATSAQLCFAAARPSSLRQAGPPMPAVPAPDACPNFLDTSFAPSFTRNFEVRRAGGAMPLSGATEPDLLVWARHRGAAGPVPGSGRMTVAALVALADLPPPAAMTMFTSPAPISTMTWSLDILTEEYGVFEDWMLLRSTGQALADGYATQAMLLWDQAGRPLLSATQCVAVFA